ncbi:MAG: hypothetical protein AB7K04_11010 [Pseudorhodoplanes sp.]
MKKTFIALAAIATLALATLAVPNTADARCRGCAVGAGVAAGVLGAAIIGGAIANSPAYAAPPPAYYRPAPVYEVEPECRMVRQRVWVEGVGYRTRRVEVCD